MVSATGIPDGRFVKSLGNRIHVLDIPPVCEANSLVGSMVVFENGHGPGKDPAAFRLYIFILSLTETNQNFLPRPKGLLAKNLGVF